MKVVCIKKGSFDHPLGQIPHQITINKIYEVTEDVIRYNKDTFKPLKAYLVKCDDGANRYLPVDMFQDLSYIRNEKLKSIGI